MVMPASPMRMGSMSAHLASFSPCTIFGAFFYKNRTIFGAKYYICKK